MFINQMRFVLPPDFQPTNRVPPAGIVRQKERCSGQGADGRASVGVLWHDRVPVTTKAAAAAPN